MILEELLKKGFLVRETVKPHEIHGLYEIVDRDLKDSFTQELSDDWRFGIAYNAALKLATILVLHAGYRVRGNGFHLNTIQLIPQFLGKKFQEYADYLDICRGKRNLLEYDSIGGVGPDDVQELQEFVQEFQEIVRTHTNKEPSSIME
jgi:hypothetical protein